MHIRLVGINHQTAPIAIREKVMINSEELPDALSVLRSYVPYAVILSTCNRTEIYTSDVDGQHGVEASLNFLRDKLGIPDVALRRYAYVFEDKAAAEHLFRVACGLDSMIVGEYEVLGQVGQALKAAKNSEMTDLPLRQVFQSAVRVGRRARTETGISKNAASSSSVAVDMATSIVGKLQNSKILVIGTGEAGMLVLKVARDRGASRIVIASRTKKRAAAVATTVGGTPTTLSNLAEELKTCNIVVACAGSHDWILDADRIEEVMNKRPELPLVIIDIAVPRNVEPAVQQIDNVYLYNIDDITEIADKNRRQREGEIRNVEEIIAAAVTKFVSWQQDFEVRPVISALMSKAENIRSAQLNRTLKKLPPLSDEQRYSLEAMTKSIVVKMLKNPIHYLKENGRGDYAEIVRELFRLDREKHS